MKALAVGGIEDHAHALLSLPATMTIAEALQLIKTASSKWLHEKRGLAGFEWQEGYGAFSIGMAQVDATVRYILNQRAHHRRRDFQEEFLMFLKKHHIDYDPRFIWG
jgi:REP element-mobilizing transposase RayT